MAAQSYWALVANPQKLLKRLIQIQKKSLIPKFSKSIIKTKIRAGGFIEKHTYSGTIAGLENLEEFCTIFVVARLQVAESYSAQEFIG
jgi:hypothetical protein